MDKFQIEQSKLVGVAFEKFNKTLLDFREFQHRLENKIQDLQQELSKKNRELSNILESLPNGLIVLDNNLNILIYNRAAFIITGIKEDKAKKTSINKLFKHNLLPKNNYKNTIKALPEKKIQEFQYIHPSGRKLYLEAKLSIMKSTSIDNQFLGVIINLQDLTIIKNLQNEAARHNRLMAMGQIAASVAHEIRNPLGGMELFVSLLKKDLKNNPEHDEAITQIQAAIRSMNHIISNILEFTRPKNVKYNNVELKTLIKDFIDFNQIHANQHDIKIESDFEKESYNIIANREQLKQMLQNLYMNAIQSMDNKGIIKIKLQQYNNKVKFNNHIIFNPVEIDKGIIIQFFDQGEGMSKKLSQKIFDPFFTTKQKGTGLGLSIVKQIVEAHKGFIAVKSTINIGTEISVVFSSN